MRQHPIWLLLDSSGLGGIETHVGNLAAALRARGMKAEIALLAAHGRHPLMETWRSSGIPVRIIGGGRALASAFRAGRPALVHAHGYKAGILARLCGRATGIPVVSTFHAGEPGSGRIRFYNFLDRLTAPLAETIAVSQPIAARLHGRATVIPNFVAIPKNTADGGRAIGFVGRLAHEKGPDQFVELAKGIQDAPFLVFGDGPMRSALEANASDNLRFRGAVAGMAGYWSEIGLLCIPSRHEGLPLVALEALSHGVPVAAFAVGALPDVIEDGRNGWIIPAGDTAMMIRRLKDWWTMDAESRQAMAVAARRLARTSFSAEVIVPRILEI